MPCWEQMNADVDFLAELALPDDEVVDAPAVAPAPVVHSDPEGDRFRELLAAAEACKAKGGTVLAQLATVQAISYRDFPRTH